jgi:hypothetical protein
MKINPNRNDELSIKDIILSGIAFCKYVFYWRKTVFITILIGSILGLTYSILQKPKYIATVSFALEDKSSGGIGSSISIDSPFGIDLGGRSSGGVFSSSNLPELFASRNMVEKTLLTTVVIDNKKLSLAEMYIQNKGWRKKWSNKPQFNSIQFTPNATRSGFTRAHDSILGIIYKNLIKNDLTVSQKDKKVSIIILNLSSDNELFAKYFAEALVEQVSNFYIDYKSKKARENVNILIKQSDSVRGQLNSAITGVAVSIDNTFNLNPALNIRKAPTSRKQVDVQANTFILTELVKQTELAKIELRKETPLIQLIDSPILPLQKDKKIGKVFGISLGACLGLLLSIFFLLFKKVFENIMK